MNIKFKKISVFVLLIFCLYTSGTFANTNDIATGFLFGENGKIPDSYIKFIQSRIDDSNLPDWIEKRTDGNYYIYSG